MKTATLVVTVVAICLVVCIAAHADTKKGDLTESEIVDIGKTYEGILQSKNKLFKLVGSRPVGEFDAEGLDLTAGGTELSGCAT